MMWEVHIGVVLGIVIYTFVRPAYVQLRGILMLDDVIIMPCADIERGFAQWRYHPERVTGFYSRILEGDPPQYQCIKVSESHRSSFVRSFSKAIWLRPDTWSIAFPLGDIYHTSPVISYRDVRATHM